MASNPPAQCCTVGVRHEGEPTGKTFKIGQDEAQQYEAYVAEPKGPNKHTGAAILYIPDALGIWQNAQLVADQFAANGYYTVIVDVLNGDPIPLNRPADYDIMKWVAVGNDEERPNPHTKKEVDPIVELALRWLKDQGFTKIGAVGYCFGGKYVLRHYKNGIQAGFIAHPSFIDEAEVAAITGPLSIAAAETDAVFTPALRHASEELLVKTGQPYQITLYSGVVHGFAVRCDLSKRVERFAREQAFLQAVQWFDEWLV